MTIDIEDHVVEHIKSSVSILFSVQLDESTDNGLMLPVDDVIKVYLLGLIGAGVPLSLASRGNYTASDILDKVSSFSESESSL